MARINSHSEADFFLDDTGRSSFVASWLHQNPQEDVGDITEKSKFTRFKLSIPGDQVDGANEGDSEILENRKGLESSLMSEHISLPSPTPSSKLSMPWNSAEELAGRSADASFFLDLETIGFKPIVSKEPRFEHINGILMMTFPCNAVREVVTYQARLEFRTDNPVFEAWDTETWAARWQFEYRPQWNDRLPRLSLGPILKSYGTGSLNRIYNFGRITLAMGTGDDIKGYTYEDCAGSDGLIDGRDLKVLLQQLATYRWLLSTFHKWRESLEQRVRKMSNSASALRLSAVRRHPTIVLLHYVLVLLLALLLMGGILFVLWKEGSAFGVALYQAGGYQSANRFWGASECRFSSHEAKMIEAGTASSPLKDSGVKAPELALSTSKSPMEATTNPIPRTSTILAPEETRSRERSHDNALRKSTGRLAMETRRFRLNPSHPNRPLLATAERSQGIYDEVSDLKMASKDDRIRDRIDRLLGWRRIYGR